MIRLVELFEQMDVSGDGIVTYDEFEMLLKVPAVSAWLELLDISTKDAENLFRAVDKGGDGEITVDEWACGISRIKGAATAVDAMTLMASVHRVEHQLKELTCTLAPPVNKPPVVTRITNRHTNRNSKRIRASA